MLLLSLFTIDCIQIFKYLCKCPSPKSYLMLQAINPHRLLYFSKDFINKIPHFDFFGIKIKLSIIISNRIKKARKIHVDAHKTLRSYQYEIFWSSGISIEEVHSLYILSILKILTVLIYHQIKFKLGLHE